MSTPVFCQVIFPVQMTYTEFFNYIMLDFGVLILLRQDVRLKDALKNKFNIFFVRGGDL